MNIDKPELDAGRAVWNAIREIYADKPRMYINPEQAWEDLNRESRTDCHQIAQAAIATVMNAGYSFSDKKIGVKHDKTGRKAIDMQATFGKESVEPNSIKTGIVIEGKQ